MSEIIGGKQYDNISGEFEFTENGSQEIHTGVCESLSFDIVGTFTADVAIQRSVLADPDASDYTTLESFTDNSSHSVTIVDEAHQSYKIVVSGYASGTVKVIYNGIGFRR